MLPLLQCVSFPRASFIYLTEPVTHESTELIFSEALITALGVLPLRHGAFTPFSGQCSQVHSLRCFTNKQVQLCMVSGDFKGIVFHFGRFIYCQNLKQQFSVIWLTSMHFVFLLTFLASLKTPAQSNNSNLLLWTSCDQHIQHVVK